MTQEPKYAGLVELLDEVEKMDTQGESKYTHAVQVLTPIDVLQQVDLLVETNSRLTRPIIFRRALRMYLKALKIAGRFDAKPKIRRRIA